MIRSRRAPALWFARRLLGAVGAVASASLLVWLLVVTLPGDPATSMLGQSATPERVADLRARLGLDRPVLVQYAEWVGGALRGDLGASPVSGRAVGPLIADRALDSLALASLSGALVLLVGVPLGFLAGARAGRPTGRVVSALAAVAVAIPEFVTGTALVALLAVQWRLLPTLSTPPPGESVWQHPETLVLPVVTLALVVGGWVVRYVRAVVTEASDAPHVVAARLAGHPEVEVLARYLAPAALAPVVQFLGWTVGLLVGGAVVVERLVQFPGLGSLLVEATTDRDLTTTAAVTVVLAAAVTAGLLISDVAAARLDPRLRPWLPR